ncbi:MAG TPA: cyclic nucleotide-binding domain-containing protein, partial [Thermoanaerobaculia bacterium]|nr:cyclic nucleotide-binding domain-containing protein [Thermoanaerobaculia bacterium]
MALGFGSKAEDVMALISRKNYSRAIEVLRAQTEANHRDPRLRMQLADVLVLAGKGREAIGILTPLADEFAQEGFAAKAIAVLKKIQKVDPGHRDVDARLAGLIQEKQRLATAAAAATSLPEIGMEEIGLEFPAGGSIAVPAERPREREPLPEPAAPELALEPLTSEPDAPELALEPLPVEPEVPELPLEPLPPVPSPATPPAARAIAAIEDPDLLYLEEADGEMQAEVEVEPEPEAEAEPADPMSDSRFAEELQALVDTAFLAPLPSDEVPTPAAPDKGGSQIVVSPLFRDFSVDEMVAVIQGLSLLSFARGDVILREGEPGDRLYMLTSGMVRAFRKDAASGRQLRVADLKEGAFFGEVSILTGGPRTATVAA